MYSLVFSIEGEEEVLSLCEQDQHGRDQTRPAVSFLGTFHTPPDAYNRWISFTKYLHKQTDRLTDGRRTRLLAELNCGARERA